jgi:hypothetical protein
MGAEISFYGYRIMSFFENKRLSEQCFNAASDGSRDKYEKLTQQKIKLQRKLRELEAQGKGNSAESQNLRSRLDIIESQL